MSDADARFSGEQALQHPWFSKFKGAQKGTAEDSLDPNIVQSLRNYKGVSTLKKAAMNILVKMLDVNEIEKLREAFLHIDTDNTGQITAAELKEALMRSNFNIPETEIDHIIDEVNYHGTKKINYTEFLAATISVKSILNDNMLLAIFKQFDTNSDGKITSDNIVEAFHKLGHKITQADLTEIV